jgi:hypothetical protein
MVIKGGCVERKGGYAFEGVWSYFFILFIILGYIYIIMKFEVMIVVVGVGVMIGLVRKVWGCCEGNERVEFEYKEGNMVGKEVEVVFRKREVVCCVVVEVDVVPKWVDVYMVFICGLMYRSVYGERRGVEREEGGICV